MTYDVITSGYVSVDRIIRVENPLKVGYTSIISNRDNAKTYFGGCPINIAFILGKMGLNILPLVRVGEDPDSEAFIQHLKSANVALDAIKVIREETISNCYIVSDKKDNHVTIFYPGAMDSKYSEEVKDEYFQKAKFGLLTVGSYKDNVKFFEKCQKHNVPIIFSTKLDFDAFPIELFKKILQKSKIIFSNESEASNILSILNIDTITDLFEIGDAEVIITTLGEKGSVYYKKNKNDFEKAVVSSYKIKNVVDATGAGDAYIAGFLYGYIKGKDVQESCYMGSVMSSFILENIGCTTNVPTPKTFKQRYEEYLKTI